MSDRPSQQGSYASGVQSATPNRRIAERYPFSAMAEIIDPSSRTRITARVADISQTGCYLDVINVFAPGTKVVLTIQHSSRMLETSGSVVYSTPGMGMGLAFTGLSSEAESILGQWISELKGDLASELEVMEPNKTPKDYTRADRQVLGRLIDIMMRKNLLSRDEASGLLNDLLQDE